MSKNIKHAKVIWNYLAEDVKIDTVECVIVCGGHDKMVIKKAVHLYQNNQVEKIIVSGGLERKIYGQEGVMQKEAFILRDLLLSEGINSKDILVEPESINTSQNYTKSVEVAEKSGYNFNQYLMIQKPYVVLRTKLTLMRVNRGHEIKVASQDISFDDYIKGDIPEVKVLNMLVGEVQRIIEYPAIGWTVETTVPTQIIRSYNYLISQGFVERMFTQETLKKFKVDFGHIEIK